MKGKELAIKYLSFRPRTVWEMRKYLIEKEQSLDDIQIIIRELLELGYLDDEKYAQDYILYGRTKNRGQIRIIKELNDKGIGSLISEAALEHIQSEEILENGKAYSERKRAEELALILVKGQEIDDKLLRKAARKLVTLGYDSDVIYGVIGVLMALRGDKNGSD